MEIEITTRFLDNKKRQAFKEVVSNATQLCEVLKYFFMQNIKFNDFCDLVVRVNEYSYYINQANAIEANAQYIANVNNL